VDPTARGEVLTVEDFARIAEGLAAQGVHPSRPSGPA
jgi:16S rRNA (adenine1518-N6/adenine1519-N6)-dimethyltransferase